MADGFTVDSSDYSKLTADIGQAADNAGKYLRPAIERTARSVKDTAKANAMGMAHAPAFPHSITYDVGTTADQSTSQIAASILAAGNAGSRGSTLYAEIGPDKERPQGALGNLIEYGSTNNPPQGIMHGALQANEADFERGVERGIDDALKAVGL